MNAPASSSAPRLRLGKTDHGRLVSSEEFANADFEEGRIYERVHGRLVVMFPDAEGGVRAIYPWVQRLVLHANAHPDVVQYVLQQPWIRIDNDTDRFPDIAVYLVSESPPPIPDRVPDLIFEIVSGTRRDRERDYDIKRSAYEKLSVKEYVIIDRFRRSVLVLENAPDGFRERTLTLSDRYETPLLPGLSIPLSEVLPA